jgi:hypothetical protein
MVRRQGKRPEDHSVATLPLAHKGGSLLDKSLGIPAADAGPFAPQPAQLKPSTHRLVVSPEVV